MDFRTRRRDEPEINLIAFIDVLLVILLFLMLSTTYSRYTELQVRLPSAEAPPARPLPRQMVVSVGADGRYAVDRQVLTARTPAALSQAMAAASAGQAETVVIINADAAAPHQAVIHVLEAARNAGLAQVTFAAQSRSGKAR